MAAVALALSLGATVDTVAVVKALSPIIDGAAGYLNVSLSYVRRRCPIALGRRGC